MEPIDELDDIEYLKLICKNCKKGNGYCIKDQPYIGLCAELDKEELLMLRREKQRKETK